MKENCYNEGTIQAFLDGELSGETLENVARHTARCEKCALMLQQSEEQSAFVFAALDNELNSLVPTERIRTNLYRAISELEEPEKPKSGIFSRLASIFAVPLAPAFASGLIIAGVFAIYLNQEKTNEIAANQIVPVAVKNIETAPASRALPQVIEAENPVPAVPQNNPKTQFATAKQNNLGSVKIQKTILRTSNDKPENNAVKKSFAPEKTAQSSAEAKNKGTVEGEDIYLKTIASLNKTVEKNKDDVLRPSVRFAFEKDLAIVDDAISKMKTEVRNNPKNEAAKEMLRTSYQSKIDLLNSVAERQNLTATLR